MNNKIVHIVILVAVAGASFYGGVLFQKSKTPAGLTMRGQGAVAGRFRTGMGGAGGMGAGGFVNGQILSADAKNITVQLPNNGGSKIVFLSGSSQIAKSVAGSATDLTVGENVLVTGTANSDGSVTASNIQIRPAMPATTPAPAK